MSTEPFRVLITGGDGFVGRHLVMALQSLDHRHEIVVGSYGSHGIEGSGLRGLTFDVTDAEQVRNAVSQAQPTHVVHLAATSSVVAAQSDVRNTWAVNLGGTLNLALALSEIVPSCRLIHCSSAEVYGGSFRAGEPLDESAILDPVSTYGASKAAADILVGQMAKRGLRAVRIRPFNHTGPGQRTNFVVADFASQIARIERGEQDPVMRVGNLASRRDFLDVRDVIDAYLRVISRFDDIPQGHPINIASGRSTAIGSILETLLSLSPVKIEAIQDEARLRSAETSVVCGNAGLARRLLGWEPRTEIEATLRSVLDYYRDQSASRVPA